MMRKSQHRNDAGFTFVEVIIVVVVLTIVSALAAPNIVSAIDNIRLRSSAQVVAGMVQAARVRAVKFNKYYYLRSTVVDANTLLWITDQPTATAPAADEDQAQLGTNVRLVTAGNPSDPDLDFTPIRNSPPIFNSHGVPCALNGPACTTTTGYQLYLTDTRTIGADGWATVVIAPGGRIQVFTYNGNNWSN